jgi:cytochrome c-type biogenesis protein CcmH
MTAFILIAIALTIAAVAVVVVPLLRRPAAGKAADGTVRPEPAIWAAFGATGVLIFGAVALYVVWSNWSWQPNEAAAGTPQGMVASLAWRLEKNPDDLEGWLMLGRSYAVLEQYELAGRAYQRADRLSGGKNAEALVGMAEALTLLDEKELEGRAGEYLEKALELDPKSGKAQFYGAAAALRRGNLPLARERFSNLLALNPPENVRPILEQQIAAIDEKLGGAPPTAGQPAPGKQATPSGAEGARPSPPSQGSPSAAAAPAVRIKVTLSPKLTASVPAGAPLFVLIRDPRRAGPPLAVKRLASQFPQNVELTTADSMLAGHTFAAGQLVEVVARVSRSGRPNESSGDLFGLAAHTVGESGVVDIVIDHVTP